MDSLALAAPAHEVDGVIGLEIGLVALAVIGLAGIVEINRVHILVPAVVADEMIEPHAIGAGRDEAGLGAAIKMPLADIAASIADGVQARRDRGLVGRDRKVVGIDARPMRVFPG